MKHTRLFVVSLSLVAASLGACKKTETKTSTSTGTGTATATATVVPGGLDLAAWDQAGKAKAWQGSWLAKENGTIQAWTITGDKLDVWDGKTDTSFTLQVTAPCRANFVSASGMSMPREFAAVDGKLQFRGDGAGYRKGASALFCDPSGDFYTLDAAGTCALWKSDGFGSSKKFVKEAGVCGIKANPKGGEVFFHEGSNSGEFEIRGDAILASTSFETEAVVGDHAAAKAARDAKAAQ